MRLPGPPRLPVRARAAVGRTPAAAVRAPALRGIACAVVFSAPLDPVAVHGGAGAPPIALALGALLLTASVTDVRARRIPNLLVGAGALVVGGLWAAASAPGGAGHLAGGMVAPLLLVGLRALGWWLRGRAGVGLGDVKLAAVLGLGLGLAAVGVVWAGLTLAGLWALTGLATGRMKRTSTLPLAPFLCAAYVLWIALAPRIGLPGALALP